MLLADFWKQLIKKFVIFYKKEFKRLNDKGGIPFGKHSNGRKKYVKLRPLKYNEFLELDRDFGDTFDINEEVKEEDMHTIESGIDPLSPGNILSSQPSKESLKEVQ